MSSARRLPWWILLVLACLGGGPRETAASERDLEPLPRDVVFVDPGGQQPPLDPETDRAVRGLIQRTFASLGTVAEARALLVHRYGLVTVPALQDVLAANRNVTEVWNAALTVAALRDREGSAYALLPLVKPLVKVLGGGGDAYTNAMAALALGCFHHHQERLEPNPANAAPALPGVRETRRRAAEALKEGRRILANNLDHFDIFLRVAVQFAMAKIGGEDVAAEFFRGNAPAANPAPRRARLLASAFLGAPDARLYQKHLLGVEAKAAQTIEEASAALAMAVALLQEEPAAWTRDAPTVLRHLRGTGTSLPEARAERVFGMGVCAHVNQSNAAWDDVWAEATRASTDPEVAAAAAQILAHCRLPQIEQRMIAMVVNPVKKPHDAVLAMVLLRAGMSGNSDALPKLVEWLRSRSRRPAANARWDPRWYVIVGLLRALHEGRIKPVAERAMVIEALRRAAQKTLDDGATPRAPLQHVLDAHGAKLATADPSALYLLPRDELARVEASFTCPYGLLALDATDACVDRVNAMVQDIFRLKNIPAWKPGADNTKFQPERYLKLYLDAFPYFSRLEFLSERGRRPVPALGADVLGIDR